MRVACRRLGWALVLAAVSLRGTPAQTPPPAPVPAKGEAAPTEASDLQTALAATAWDANARGPLLVLDPANVTPWTPHDGDDSSAYTEDDPPPVAVKPLALPIGRDRLRLETTAAHFGRKLVRIGSLAVLAPTEMVVLNENPPARDPFARLGRSEKFRMLAATFDAAQWKALGSASGLGLSQLDKDQQALFLSYLPNPFKLRRGVTSAGRGIDYSGGKKDAVVVTEEQRRGIRLRLNIAAQVSLLKAKSTAQNGEYEPTYFPVSAKPVGQPVFSILARDNYDWGAREVDGVTLSAKVPSRLKAGQIAFDAPALDARVSLAVGGAGQTLGDLVKRIAEATGLELYADPRIARLTVWSRLPQTDNANPQAATTVRAGDLLQGLCWCVTGAVRRVEAVRTDSLALAPAASLVAPAPPSLAKTAKGAAVVPTAVLAPARSGPGPAFVLTDDVTGVGVRKARLAEWYEQGNAYTNALTTRLNVKIQSQNVMSYLDFGPNDPFALPGPVMGRVQAGWKYGEGRFQRTNVRTAQLSREQQMLVQQAARALAVQPQSAGGGGESSGKPGAEKTALVLNNDEVAVRVVGRMTLTVPGVGEVEDSRAMGTNLVYSVLPPAERWSYEEKYNAAPSTPVVLAPDIARGSALFVAPRDADGAVNAVQAAQKRGLTQVWLAVDGDTAAELNLAPLQAGIAEGQKTGVAVYAVARVLSLGGHAGGVNNGDVQENKALASAPSVKDAPAVPNTAEANGDSDKAATAPDAARDVNVFGEPLRRYVARQIAEAEAAQTGERVQALRAELRDYRRPDLPETADVVREKLLAIIQTPGLSGLILHETAAPGAGVAKVPRWVASINEGGYAPEMRLAFLRRTGADPLDFAPRDWIGGLNLTLPFFAPATDTTDEPGETEQQWGAFRFSLNARLMTGLYRDLRAAKPDLPIVMQERGSRLWWGTWDKADVFPAGREAREDETAGEAQIARETANRRLLAAYFAAAEPSAEMADLVKPDPWPADSPQAFAKSVNERMKSLPGKWDGVVFDLSDLPVGKALSLFAAGVAKPSAVTTARGANVAPSHAR